MKVLICLTQTCIRAIMLSQEACKVARAMPLCLLKQIICLSNEGRKYEQEQTAPDLLFS